MKKLKYAYIPAGIITVMLVLNFLLVFFEKQSDQSSITNISKAFWYMTVTLTTVGYGDYFPITTGGKIIGYF